MSSKLHRLYVVKRVGDSELLTVTGNEAGVTCCQELSQYLCGETNTLHTDETLMVVVVMMMMMHGPILFLILNICASSSLIHSPLQLALLQSLFPTQ